MVSFIGDKIEEVAKQFPEHIALQIYRGEACTSYTYHQTVNLARSLSESLKKRRIGKGDRVAIWSPSGPEWAITYLAVLYSGAVVVPLDLEYVGEQALHILLETGCKLVFTTADKLVCLLEIITMLPEAPMVVSLESKENVDGVAHLDQLLQENNHSTTPVAPSPEDVATIIYTSGTTGRPKGVVIPHRSVTTTVLGMLQYLGITSEDNVLAVVPAHHVFAPIGSLLVPLAGGGTITYLRSVKSTDLLQTLRHSKITIFPCVPQVFYLLHKRIMTQVACKPLVTRVLFGVLRRVSYRLRQWHINVGKVLFPSIHQALGGRLRLLISGGSYLDPRVARDLYGLGFTVQQGYGLTESFGGGTFTPAHHNVLGTVGVALPDVQVKIVDPDAAGVGEIAISGAPLMHGYLNDSALTSEVLRNGWLYTGDLGYADQRGNLHITGRKKEMIVLSSGKKMFPQEIEEHYLQSPYVKEMCVIGISDSSDYAEAEKLHAIVVPDFDYLKEHKIVNSKEAIRDEIEKRSTQLPMHKRILSYEIRAQPLPRTATKKLMRWVVKSECKHWPRETDPSQGRQYSFWEGDELLLETEVSRQVLNQVKRESSTDSALHLDMNLELDLGFDSLRRIELIANIEQALHIRLSDDAISQCFTVRDLLKQVAQQMSRGQSGLPEGAHSCRVTWKEILASASPEDPAASHVLKSRPILTLLNFALLKASLVVAKLLFQLRVDGMENLPRHGPYLICPNHQGYLDGVLLASTFPYSVVKDLFSLGWSPYYKAGARAMLARMVKTVPIDPDTNLLPAMKISSVGLKAKKILLVFPEGGMTSDGDLQSFKKGAAILARELEVPITPVAIKGSFNVWSKVSGGIRLAPVKIKIGTPLNLNAKGHPHTSGDDDYAEGAESIRKRIRDLLKSE